MPPSKSYALQHEGLRGIEGAEYDPFLRGPFPVGVRSFAARDKVRNRLFPWEVWYPAAAQHAGQDLAPETQDTFTSRFPGGRRRSAKPQAGREAIP